MSDDVKTTPLSAATARAEITKVIDHITAARRQLNEGHAVSLAPLEEITRTACRTAAGLPAEDRRALRPLLEAVLYDLDILAADLTARYGALARRADTGGRRPPTVGDAYRRSDQLVPRPAPPPDADDAAEAEPEKS